MVDCDRLPPNVLALLLKHVALLDHESATSFESTCKRVSRVSAEYLVWLDVATAFSVADCEAALCLSPACRAISLAESELAALPIGDDSMFDNAAHSPVHVSFARFVAPFNRTVRAQLVAVYERICGAAATCARRNAVCRELVLHWRPLIAIEPRYMPLKIEGFYTARYGSHGTELVWLERDGWRLRALKLTGDPNVPAGEVSLDLLLARDVGRALGRVRLAEAGFRAPFWGVAFAATVVRVLDIEWAEQDRFVFYPCASANAFQWWTLAPLTGHDAAPVGVHRLPFDRLPQRVRDEFQRVQLDQQRAEQEE